MKERHTYNVIYIPRGYILLIDSIFPHKLKENKTIQFLDLSNFEQLEHIQHFVSKFRTRNAEEESILTYSVNSTIKYILQLIITPLTSLDILTKLD